MHTQRWRERDTQISSQKTTFAFENVGTWQCLQGRPAHRIIRSSRALSEGRWGEAALAARSTAFDDLMMDELCFS